MHTNWRWYRWGVKLLIMASCAGGQLAHASCSPLTGAEKARLVTYVAIKYSVPDTVALSITDSVAVSDDCNRRLLFAGTGPLGVFTLTLYASPNLRFLSPELMDSFLDPSHEREEKARALMAKLTEGEFATKGRLDAPVTLVVFSDFQCPFCRHAAEILEQEPLIRDGSQVRIVFRHFPLAQHDWAQEAAMGAACAQFQSETAFWKFHDALFAEQGSMVSKDIDSRLNDVARRITSLDLDKFQECLSRQMSLGTILRDKALGAEIGVNATPTVYMNGKVVSDIDDQEKFHAILSKGIVEAQRATLFNPAAQKIGGDNGRREIKADIGVKPWQPHALCPRDGTENLQKAKTISF